jgi:hypothetical protein
MMIWTRRDPADLAIHQHREIQLALNVRTGLDVHDVDGQAFGPRLMCNQLFSKHFLGCRMDFVAAARELHATGLASPSRVHLRLDHPKVAAQLLGRIGRRIRALDGDAAWYLNAVLGKQSL